ncbi:MAG TPA: hypothetical protein VNA57_02895 [Acidimicrobiales bacterium]|nr:hypothetical protein [Acidimicrobiales bacterium]
MATSTNGMVGEQPVAAEWVLVLTKAGAYQGMVGPFASAEEADGWATAMFAGTRTWSWRREPVVPPASLPEVGRSAGATVRPQLEVVR